jgi:outer membrane protein
MQLALPLCLDLNLNNHKKLGMKKILVAFATLLLLTTAVEAQQRYAIIDTKYILSKIPEYRDADKKLQLVGEQWQKEIDDKQAVLDKMYKNYEAEQIMLTDDLKKKREDEVFVKEKEIRDLQKKRFGYEGDLFKERQKLVKPIQDKVYNAIQKIAVARVYDFILDKSEGITVIFADPKLDKSDEVLRELGIKN